MRSIFCCECQKEQQCRCISGSEAYPRRPDLSLKKFWQCPDCKNFVGTHNKGYGRKPLGSIPNKEMKEARQHIHSILDPLWRSGQFGRGEIYKKISDHLGYEYHTGELRTIDEARKVWSFIKQISKQAKQGGI